MSEALSACPFCGGSDLEIRENGRTWRGSSWGEPASVSVWHHCEATPGQPSRGIERVGRDRASAIAAWNRRAPTGTAGATNPNELTSSPEPAPALRAAELPPLPKPDSFEYMHGIYWRPEHYWNGQRASESRALYAEEKMQDYAREAVRASGLLPVAREGLSDEDVEILAAVKREMEEHDDNAPGHAHSKPGIWDDDNEPGIAGQPCAWCLTWRKFTALIDRAERSAAPTPLTGATKPNVPDPAPSLEGVRNA